MSTNDESETEVQETEVSTDAEADLQAAKAEAENKSQAEETEQVAQSTEPAEADEKSEATLTTEVPSEHDLEWYKTAYEQSTKEALRLKGELDNKIEAPQVTGTSDDSVLTPEQLYVKQMLIKESDEAFAGIVEKYPSVKDPDTYKRFSETAKIVSKTIVDAEKRLPLAKELYDKTAIILGLQADISDELGAALKDGASSSKTPSTTPGSAPKSKVTEEMIETNLKMYPTKTRAEIIEELEPHIN